MQLLCSNLLSVDNLYETKRGIYVLTKLSVSFLVVNTHVNL